MEGKEKVKFQKKAILISGTQVAGRRKDRWECPDCRENKRAECRFNLSPEKRGKVHRCRFCKTDLLLDGGVVQ